MGTHIRGLASYQPRVVLDAIEAVQLTKGNMHDVAAWSHGRVYEETGDYSDFRDDREPEHYLSILSKHGIRKAKIGDYVVKKAGEFQPYPQDKFERAYKRVASGDLV